MLIKVNFYLLVVFCLHIIDIQCSIKPIAFINKGYESVTVVIRNNVKENSKIIENLKEILTKASLTLWTATQNRAYFRQFNIIVPQHWTKQPNYTYISDYCVENGNIRIDTNVTSYEEPYTEQLGGCGEPGKVINLPLNFILEQQNYKNKEIVKQWAHYRYGVFNEHGIRGEGKWPSISINEDGMPIPNICKKTNFIFDGPGDKCELNVLNQQIDPLCTIKPVGIMKASLMFKPFTDQMESFCTDNSNDLDHYHNKGTFTQHNIKCGDRSVSNVIFSHQDFKIQNTTNVTPTPPTFNIYKQDKTVTLDQIFVLLFDVSGSMSGTRIEVISKAAQQFINTLAPNGLKLGIAQFHTTASVLHPIVEINAQTRQTLLQAVPTRVLDSTSISAVLITALNMINNYTLNRAATIVLMTDGQENTAPYINSAGVIDAIKSRGIQVNTFAIGNDASSLLEKLAKDTDGDGLFFSLNGVVDSVALAQEISGRFIKLASVKCEEDPQSVLVMNKISELSAQQSVYYVPSTVEQNVYHVPIDPQLGRNTVFLVSSQDLSKIVVKYKSPDNRVYDNSSTEYKISNNTVQLTIADCKSGQWSIIIERESTANYSLGIQVFSEIRYMTHETIDYPIRLIANLSHTIVDPSNPPKVFAELKKGNLPVLLATVTGIVETPNGLEEHVILLDNGVGADAIRNDGIYSAYFTNYTVQGRYNIKVEAVSNGDARIRTGSKNIKPITNITVLNNSYEQLFIENFTQVFAFSNIESELTAVNDFSRTINVGAFRLEKAKSIDSIAPSVVSDLTLVYVNENERTVTIHWTSAGNDMNTGTAKQVIIRAAYHLVDIINKQIFDTLYQFNNSQVVSGSLNPLSGGLKHIISLSLRDLWKNGVFSVFVALKTVDHTNNASPISNAIMINLGVLEKVNILYSSQYTFGERMFAQRYELNITSVNSNKTGASFVLNADSLSSLDIYYKTPNGTIISIDDNRLSKDELKNTVVLNYNSDAYGVWSLYLERLNFINARDIHFSVQVIQK